MSWKQPLAQIQGKAANNLEKIHQSMGFLKNFCEIILTNCKMLKRFPSLCISSLKYLTLHVYASLELFPEILGSMELHTEIHRRLRC